MTARQRQLMVKEFELDPFADIWLVLDLDQRIMAGSGVESVEEYAVTICASRPSRMPAAMIRPFVKSNGVPATGRSSPVGMRPASTGVCLCAKTIRRSRPGGRRLERLRSTGGRDDWIVAQLAYRAGTCDSPPRRSDLGRGKR